MIRIRFPLVPRRRATRCPARFSAAGTSAHSTVKPMDSSSGRYISPTRRTPATFSVPLFTFTVRSTSAIAAGTSASAARTMRRSTGDKPFWARDGTATVTESARAGRIRRSMAGSLVSRITDRIARKVHN